MCVFLIKCSHSRVWYFIIVYSWGSKPVVGSSIVYNNLWFPFLSAQSHPFVTVLYSCLILTLDLSPCRLEGMHFHKHSYNSSRIWTKLPRCAFRGSLHIHSQLALFYLSVVHIMNNIVIPFIENFIWCHELLQNKFSEIIIVSAFFISATKSVAPHSTFSFSSPTIGIAGTPVNYFLIQTAATHLNLLNFVQFYSHFLVQIRIFASENIYGRDDLRLLWNNFQCQFDN